MPNLHTRRALIVLALAAVMTGCTSSSGTCDTSSATEPHFTMPPSGASQNTDAAVSFTPAEQRFLTKVRSLVNGSDVDIVGYGKRLCGYLETGMSYSQVSQQNMHGGTAQIKRTVIVASIVAFCPHQHGKVPPPLTPPEQQAIISAKSYLQMSGFSRSGLIQQLSSSSGEGLSYKVAVFAVNHVHADWNAEAVQSAKSYMQMGGYSRASLIDQLHSRSGEGFTLAQATYAANRVGLR